ncbi:mevalonate kinase family protein [Flagellimonas halotolerans]|uniref:Galactokinase family protein n=1 Tax=Flagellimonas halotolerans TaxID=3112164 RepID=A0ABU6ISI6_9FLAO|nr:MULTISPECIES: galactokinase family protein [unclassified Allomuricauda]MEC3966216.1 galactokinase family protein [Muricauda sp. SYSU M86414]MEC4266098.1 galactokinase family protein [Muricauda sp. SYSU M84420]
MGLLNTSMDTTEESESILVQAPGRTCLFGNHQDYLGLPVIACDIHRHIVLRATKNSAGKFRIHKPDIGEYRVIDIMDKIEYVEKEDHLLAAIKILATYGCIPNSGYDICIKGNITINAGTSSSSAVVVAWIRFMTTAFGCERIVTKELISRLAYEAEVAFHGSSGGKMDQYSIALGHVIYLETSGTDYHEIFETRIPGPIVGESGIPKQTTGVLWELKEKALLAIAKVRERLPTFDIRQVSGQEFPKYAEYIPDDLKICFEAAVLNHDITQRALLEFRKPSLELETIGKLMNEHYHVLKEYLKITLPLIDDMVHAALRAGALGGKIVGYGRGGSIVALALPD